MGIHIRGHAAFQCDTNLGFHHVGRRMSAAYPKFLLSGDYIKDLVGMRRGSQAAHGFDHNRTTYAVIPCLAKIIVATIQHHEWRIRNHWISGLYAHVAHVVSGLCPNVEKDHVAREDTRTLVRWHQVNIA